jgi:choline-glycine betaine transporter
MMWEVAGGVIIGGCVLGVIHWLIFGALAIHFHDKDRREGRR